MKCIFRKVPREQLANIAENIIKALADKRNFDLFTFTLDIKHPRFGCASELKINDEMDDVSDYAKDAAKKMTEKK